MVVWLLPWGVGSEFILCRIEVGSLQWLLLWSPIASQIGNPGVRHTLCSGHTLSVTRLSPCYSAIITKMDMLRTTHWLHALDSRNLLFTDLTWEGFLIKLNHILSSIHSCTEAQPPVLPVRGVALRYRFTTPNHHPGAEPVPRTS